MPSFDPYDEKDFARLRKSMKKSWKDMRPFRDVRELVTEAARGHYYKSEDDPPNLRRDPVNMLDQYVQILVRSFIQSTPRVRVTSRKFPRFAPVYQEHLQQTLHEIKVVDTLRSCVQEALLGYMGIAYLAMGPSKVDLNGEPFMDPVTLPNFMIDMSKDHFSQTDYMGHRTTQRVNDLKGNKLWDQEELANYKESTAGTSSLEDRKDRRQRNEGALFDTIDIWAMNVRTDDMVVYVGDGDSFNKPLRAEWYDGPEFGPYVFLAFDNVLDELLPNSRGAMVLDLHEFVNGQYRRIFMKEDQAAEFHTYEGGGEEDARRIRDAMDGEFVRVDNNAGVQRRTKGGTNPQSLGTAIHGRQLFDELTGNIRRTGGVSSTADTATEARLDNVNTSRLIRDMQRQVIDFTRQCYQILAWYVWTQPTRTRRVEIKRGKGGNAIRQALWSPEEREGDFVEYDIDIEPDSFEHRSSRQQLNELMQAIQGVVIPAMQMPSDRPVVLKTPELVEKYSELADLPELAEVTEYAIDESSVNQPQTSGSALRIPAGATSEGRLNGGVRGGRGTDQGVEQALLASALSQSGNQGEGQ
jgi:hypothetical protein